MKQEFQKTLSSVFKQKTEDNHKKIEDILDRLDTPTAYLSSFDNTIWVEPLKLFDSNKLAKTHASIQAEMHHEPISLKTFATEWVPPISTGIAGITLWILYSTLKVARDVPVRVAEEQKKVTLYEKRLETYNAINELAIYACCIKLNSPVKFLLPDDCKSDEKYKNFEIYWASDIDQICLSLNPQYKENFYENFTFFRKKMEEILHTASSFELLFTPKEVFHYHEIVKFLNDFTQYFNKLKIVTGHYFVIILELPTIAKINEKVIRSLPGRFGSQNTTKACIDDTINQYVIKSLQDFSYYLDSNKNYMTIRNSFLEQNDNFIQNKCLQHIKNSLRTYNNNN